MSIDELVELARSEGAYQPILVDDEEVSPGWRECHDRWNVIRPYLDHGQTVMDIGSHYGYFTYQIAKEYDSFVWSIEAGDHRARIQQGMLAANKLPNVVLSKFNFTLAESELLLQTCFTADVILLLSVAHYFPPQELPEILDNLSQLAPVLIIEFPSKDEAEVAAKENVHAVDIKQLLERSYDQVELIGNGMSPKHANVNRPIYRCSRDTIKRTGAKSYIGNESGRSHTVKYSPQLGWTIDGRARRFPGMTIENLRHFGIEYPGVDSTLQLAARRYDELIGKHRGAVTDIHIRNVLLTDYGIELIDYTEGIGKTIYDIPWPDYVKRTLARAATGSYHYEEFKRMWAGTWTP